MRKPRQLFVDDSLIRALLNWRKGLEKVANRMSDQRLSTVEKVRKIVARVNTNARKITNKSSIDDISATALAC